MRNLRKALKQNKHGQYYIELRRSDTSAYDHQADQKNAGLQNINADFVNANIGPQID